MRVKNISTHPVDDILPGKEGEIRDTKATRALIEGKILEALEPLPAEIPPKTRRMVDVYEGRPVAREHRAPTVEEAQAMLDAIRERDKKIAAMEVRLNEQGVRTAELEDLLQQRDARIAGLEEELAALKDKPTKGRNKD